MLEEIDHCSRQQTGKRSHRRGTCSAACPSGHSTCSGTWPGACSSYPASGTCICGTCSARVAKPAHLPGAPAKRRETAQLPGGDQETELNKLCAKSRSLFLNGSIKGIQAAHRIKKTCCKEKLKKSRHKKFLFSIKWHTPLNSTSKHIASVRWLPRPSLPFLHSRKGPRD